MMEPGWAPPEPVLVFRSSLALRILAIVFTVAFVPLALSLLILLALEGLVLLGIAVAVGLGLVVAVLWRAARARIELREQELVVVGVLETGRFRYEDIAAVEDRGPLGGVNLQLRSGRWKRLPNSPFNVISDLRRVRRIPDELHRRVQQAGGGINATGSS